jgi:hypothetical protein
VHSNLFPDDKAIGHEFADRLAGVGIGYFAHFVRIKPDLALAASNNRCGKSLLGPEVNPM